MLAPHCSSAELGGDFSLTDHNGEPYNLQKDRGKVILLSFGYTSCPDVCPLTLALVTATMRQLGERAAQVRPLFISVDPQRDTPQLLKSYVRHFHPSIIGLTGSLDELRAVSARFNTTFTYSGDTSSQLYTVNHNSNLFVLDRTGQLSHMIPFGFPLDAVLESLTPLLAAP